MNWSLIRDKVIAALIAAGITAITAAVWPRSRQFFLKLGKQLFRGIGAVWEHIARNWLTVGGWLALLFALGGVYCLTRNLFAVLVALLISVANMVISRNDWKSRYYRQVEMDAIATSTNFTQRYRNPPTGDRIFHSVPFTLRQEYFETTQDVRDDALLAIPKAIAQATRIYLLVVTANSWLWFGDTEIATVTLMFGDESSQETKLVLGQNVREWSPGNAPDRLVTTVKTKRSRVAWTGQSERGTEALIDCLEIPVQHQHAKQSLIGIRIRRSIPEGKDEDKLALAIFAITVEHWRISIAKH